MERHSHFMHFTGFTLVIVGDFDIRNIWLTEREKNPKISKAICVRHALKWPNQNNKIDLSKNRKQAKKKPTTFL